MYIYIYTFIFPLSFAKKIAHIIATWPRSEARLPAFGKKSQSGNAKKDRAQMNERNGKTRTIIFHVF